jgi:hypothetical protein
MAVLLADSHWTSGLLRLHGGTGTMAIAGAMPSWRTDGPVAAGADPYIDPARQKAVFNISFNEPGEVRQFEGCRGKNCFERRYQNEAGILPVLPAYD